MFVNKAGREIALFFGFRFHCDLESVALTHLRRLLQRPLSQELGDEEVQLCKIGNFTGFSATSCWKRTRQESPKWHKYLVKGARAIRLAKRRRKNAAIRIRRAREAQTHISQSQGGCLSGAPFGHARGSLGRYAPGLIASPELGCLVSIIHCELRLRLWQNCSCFLLKFFSQLLLPLWHSIAIRCERLAQAYR